MEITSQQLYFAAWVIFVIFIFFMYMNLQSNDHQLYTPAGTPQNWQDFDDDEDLEDEDLEEPVEFEGSADAETAGELFGGEEEEEEELPPAPKVQKKV